MNNRSFLFVLFALTALGQSQAGHPQFDAASVRLNQSSDRASTRYDAGRVVLTKASLKHVVRRAWPVPDYQVVWPAWVGEQRGAIGYDVSVTFPPGTTPENLELMFQDLLATRFGLAMHWEMRDVRVFEVTAPDRGAKLHEAVNPAPPTDYPKYSARTTKGEWTFSSKLGGAPSGLTIGGLLEALNQTGVLDRPLVDATGIKGYYDIDFTAPTDVPDNKPAPNQVIGAMEKQLGLKATLKTAPLRMLVIDHLERVPTEN